MTNDLAPRKSPDLLPSLPPLGLSALNRHMEAVVVDAIDHAGNPGKSVRFVVPGGIPEEETAALREVAVGLGTMLTPGPRSGVAAVLARRAIAHSKDRSAEEWKIVFEDYCDDLAEFSAAHVNEAMVEHRRSSNWYPTIAELRGRCLQLRQRDVWRHERANRLLGIAA